MELISYTPQSILRFILFSRLRFRVLMLTLSGIATVAGFAGLYMQKIYLDLTLGIEHDNDLISRMTATVSPAGLIAVSFSLLVAFYVLTQLSNIVGGRESGALQSELARICYRKALSYRPDGAQVRTTGEISSVFSQDISNACFIMDFILPQGLAYILPLVSAPFVLNYFFEVPVWPVLTLATLFVAASYAFAVYQKSFFVTYKNLVSMRLGVITEMIRHFKLVRILGWTPALGRRVRVARENETAARVQMVVGGMLANSVASSLAFFVNIAIILILYKMSLLPATSGGILAVLWMVAIFLTKPFRSMPYLLTLFFNCYSSIARLSSYLMSDDGAPQAAGRTAAARPRLLESGLAVQLRGLSYTAGSRKILDSVDLDIKKGSFTAIIGEVGSGKTSLILSLLGETRAASASYEVFGHGDKEWGANLSSVFGYVPQDGFLLNATLRTNVSLEFHPDSSADKDIMAALQAAQFDLNQDGMSQGLDTPIGENGVTLSGGQKLRINIARALFRGAKILLLDECFSALDLKTEKRLIDSLMNLPDPDMTKIAVTHRLSVLERVDHVIIMDSGRIVEQGSYAELMKGSERLRRLMLAEQTA